MTKGVKLAHGVRPKSEKCHQCGGPVPSDSTWSSYCSESCVRAYWAEHYLAHLDQPPRPRRTGVFSS